MSLTPFLGLGLKIAGKEGTPGKIAVKKIFKLCKLESEKSSAFLSLLIAGCCIFLQNFFHVLVFFFCVKWVYILHTLLQLASLTKQCFADTYLSICIDIVLSL